MTKLARVISVCCALSLLLAIGQQSSTYYDYLRLGITISAGYIAYEYYQRSDAKSWIFVAIAFLFNPVMPIFMEKSSWQVVDLIVAIIFLLPLGETRSQGYSIKPSRLNMSGGYRAYTTEMERVKNEYGKLIEKVMADQEDKYPAFVFPVSLLPASKADINEALLELERQATADNDMEGANAAGSARVLLDCFIADEDAYTKNKDLMQKIKQNKHRRPKTEKH